MKIIIKVIANRLKKVLELIILDTQGAFLPGRLISDNIMISFEIMHYLKKKKFDTTEAGKVMELMALYEMASSQRVNKDKSTIFFSANVIDYNKDIALSSYAMSVYLLPLELTKEIEKEMNKFYWDTSSKSRSKIHWMSWDRLTRHKHAGGLGFKNLRDFNLAMLGKQCWRLITNPESLVAKVYRSKYFADTNFLEAKMGGSPGFIWRSIMEARNVVSTGSTWRIGTGNDINILNQPWLSD
ncbi:hypothetical protein AgCh_029715 [Apium graveolens]